MKLFEFEKHFPDEESCRERFREQRIREGVVCPKCGCVHHYWKADKQMFQCKGCGYRQSLRAHTVMHGSKLPFRYWFVAMHLLTATKHSFSAIEIQRQLGHHRYQPIWEMVHKLRSIMGKRDDKYTLAGNVEIDEGFFTTEIPVEEKEQPLKRGAGSQAKTKVLVIAESADVENPKKGHKPKRVGHIKMVVIPDQKAPTIDAIVSKAVDANSSIVSDDTKSHIHFKDMFTEHKSLVINPKDIGKVLPWVHIAISNAKSLFADLYHGVKHEFLQEYLNEFCYKFNRRYFGEDLFSRLLMIGASYRSDFSHKTYSND